MSRSSKDSGAVEAGEVVFSSSLPAAFQGRPEDDWTLDPRHAPLIIGGQVRPSSSLNSHVLSHIMNRALLNQGKR